jgi:hypothetical protein
VGTHALTATSQVTLWGRLRQHRGHLAGPHPGGGNHRASVFRRHVAEGPDQPSTRWLGRHAARTEITQSGLWNIDHIRHHRESSFPDLLERLVQQQ